MKQCMQEIAKNNEGKLVLVISHGCAIEAFLKDIDNVPLTEQKEKYKQSNAGINVLEYNDGNFKITKINQTNHL